MRISSVVSLMGFLLVISVGCKPELGVVNGIVLDNVTNEQGIDVALKRSNDTKLELLSDGRVEQETLTDSDGRYTFKDLKRGSYRIRATIADGRSTEEDADVLPHTTTVLNFIIVPSKAEGVFPSYAGLAWDPSTTPNPDLNRNGLIDLDDYITVTENAGQDPYKLPGDLNNDGTIDNQDLELLSRNFGRAVLRLGADYEALVTPGGTIFSIGSGEAFIQSGTGNTIGTLEATNQPNIVRVTVKTDRGTATSEQIGDFEFKENLTNPSWIDVNLNTGRVVDGLLTLHFTGRQFSGGLDIEGTIPDGLIALAPGGFSLYHLVGVTGTLPSEFPGYGGVTFTAKKCDPPPPKPPTPPPTPGTPCATVAPVGNCLLGVQCAPNATCTLSGGPGGPAGTCVTLRNPNTAHCSCQCQ